jgi:hypothetical protein
MLTKAQQLKRNGRLKPKPFKDKEYLSWLHNQGLICLVCGSKRIELHHLDSGSRGRADNKCVPLCADHHRGRFSPHGPDAKEFHDAIGKETLESIASQLFEKYKESK